jgi:putative transposase
MIEPLSKRRAMVSKEEMLSIDCQCDLLSIHKSGIYYKPVEERAENLVIMLWLDKQYFETPFYGKERLLVLLRQAGYLINRKRLKRLMEIVNWRTLYTKPNTSRSTQTDYKYPYLLKELSICRRNQVWQTDITYIPMERGYMYLIAIIDVYSRYIVGWSVSNTMTAEWCAEVVEEAVYRHGVPEIVNTDQGSQFTSLVFISMLQNHKITISMDGKGRAIDNIFIERFWRTIKYEDIYLKVYNDGGKLDKGIAKYMKFYNEKRIHQSLSYQTPMSRYLLAA